MFQRDVFWLTITTFKHLDKAIGWVCDNQCAAKHESPKVFLRTRHKTRKIVSKGSQIEGLA